MSIYASQTYIFAGVLRLKQALHWTMLIYHRWKHCCYETPVLVVDVKETEPYAVMCVHSYRLNESYSTACR